MSFFISYPLKLLNFIILSNLQIMHIARSKSQLVQSAHSSQIQNIQSFSTISIKHQNLSIKSQNLPDLCSQISQKPRTLFQNVQYKYSLMKLMVMVKLERLGYKTQKLNNFINEEVNHLQSMDSIQAKYLDSKATKIAQNIITHLLTDDNTQLLVFRQPNKEKQLAQKQQQRENTITKGVSHDILCSICYNISTQYCQQECGHSFCMDCMRGYIKENQKSGNYIVKCPQFECSEYITQSILKVILNAGEIQRFLYFKHKMQNELNPNNKFCSQQQQCNIRPDCGELLQITNDRLKCNKCLTCYCQICLHIYHDDNPCDIVLKYALQDTYKSLRIKKCPSCKSPIEKLSGCNHMTCKKCKFQFCWLCLKKYSGHHFRYYNCFGCPGMQFEEEGEVSTQRAKQLLLFLMLPLVISLVFFCFVSVIPIYMAGQFLYKPCYWIDSEHQFFEVLIVNNLCCCLGEFLNKLIKWILFQPRSILNAIFLAPVKITLIFCEEFCKMFSD